MNFGEKRLQACLTFESDSLHIGTASMVFFNAGFFHKAFMHFFYYTLHSLPYLPIYGTAFC